jgi:hypothetical protein
MGRSTPANNANATYGTQSTDAFNNAQTDINQFNTNEQTLASGKNIGANPFQSSAYLSNQNKLQSEALDTSAASGKASLQRWNRATGGLNSSEVPLAQRDITLQTGRLGDTLSAERSAQDYKSNLAWQQYLAQAPLSAAGAESPLYGTATGGQGNALNNLTSLSGQQYGFYGGMIDSALSGGSLMGAAKIAGCWIAMALYGDDDPRTHLLRSWLNDEFEEHAFGRAVMKLYRRYGETIGAQIRRFRPLGWLFRPLFELGLVWARHDRREFPWEAF